MKKIVLLISLSMLLVSGTLAIKTLPTLDVDQPGKAVKLSLIWQNNLDDGLIIAATEYQPVLILFSSPDCSWCARLKAVVLADPETILLLRHFSLVEIDVSKDKDMALRYQIRGVPTIVILSADGRTQAGISGYVAAAELRTMLKKALNPEFLKKIDDSYAQLLKLLDGNNISIVQWPQIINALGASENRKELHDLIFALTPFPQKKIITLLEHPRIAVRLGALEILEELTGDTFGFDPWLEEWSLEANMEALAKWKSWADGKEEKSVKSLYSALTQEQIASYIQDIVSDNRERSIRAMRMLEQAGPNVSRALSEFLQKNYDLSLGVKNRIKEVQYTLLLSSAAGVDPPVLAHRLVFGTLDVRLKSIVQLQDIGAKGIPILKEFLEDRDAIVRETAADAIVAAGRPAVSILKQHLKTEKDIDVIYGILRGLGSIRSKLGLSVLTEYLSHSNEDLVIAALNSVARLKSKTAGEEVGKCLDDSRWRVRVAALAAVGKLKLKALTGKVESMLDDKDDFVRYSAVKALTLIASKKAADKLEEAFLREDVLKAPIIAAFGSMDMPLPQSFAKALEGKSPDILLSVIEAMRNCGIRDLDLGAGFIEHDDLDVACAAIRLIGSRGMGITKYQSRITDVLKSGNREMILAALESIVIREEAMLPYQTFFAAWFTETEEVEKVKPNTALDSLFDAFLEDNGEQLVPPGPAKDKPGTAGSATSEEKKDTNDVSIQDIFSAFMDEDDVEKRQPDAATKGRVKSEGSLPVLIKEIESLLDSETKDKEICFKAALLLARLGNPRAIPFIKTDLSLRTVSDRKAIAKSLSKIRKKDVLPILRKLLQDPSEGVRETAIQSCFEHAASPAFIALVFEELSREGTRLLPDEVYGYRIGNATRQSSGRRTVGKWARKILEESRDRDILLQNFALILLEKCWKRSDEKIVEKFLDSENPWQRRAAFHTLGKGYLAGFRKKLSKAAEDPSEYVRMVIPNIYASGSSQWVHYFDKTHFDNDHYYWSSSSGSRRRLTTEEKQTLQKLTEDISTKVRVEAFLCLLSNREKVDLARFVAAINSLPDRKAIGRRVAQYLTSNYKKLGPGFKVLVPYLDKTGSDESTLKKVRKHFQIDPDSQQEEISYISRAREPEEIPATFLDTPEEVDRPAERSNLKLVYFSSPGCGECERVEKLLPELREYFPGLQIDTYNIRKIEAMRLNEALCARFGVSEVVRLVTPVVFCGGGYLLKKDITFVRLGELLARSATVPREEWYVVSKEELVKAESAIGERYSALGIGVVTVAGLLDGINPCAFATIIFFMSYLHITRRRPKEIAQVGLAFIVAVFLAYFALGLGLVEIVSRLQILQRFGQIMNWTIAAFALVIMILNIRDGVLCLQGRLKDMTLQLPGFLKTRIHDVIRRGTRHAHFVIAAFVMGLVISILELACTGQVYAPTILFMLKTGKGILGTMSYLVIYNVSFVIPLIVIFVFAYYGMKNDSLIRFLEKHAAVVKFSTAGLFFILFMFFVFGNKLAIIAQSF